MQCPKGFLLDIKTSQPFVLALKPVSAVYEGIVPLAVSLGECVWESGVLNEGFNVLKEPLVKLSAKAALILKWIYWCEFHWTESDHMDDLNSHGRNQKCYKCLCICVWTPKRCLLTGSSRGDPIARIAIKNDTTIIKLNWEELSYLQLFGKACSSAALFSAFSHCTVWELHWVKLCTGAAELASITEGTSKYRRNYYVFNR